MATGHGGDGGYDDSQNNGLLHFHEQIEDLDVEMQGAFSRLVADKFYQTQTDIARFLEIAYIKLCDHADLAGTVRLTAQSAKTLHRTSTSLLRSFQLSAMHIVSDIMPVIKDAITNQDKELFIAALDRIKDKAVEMKQEAEATYERYLKLDTEIQAHIAQVQSKSQDVRRTLDEVRKQKEAELQLFRERKLAEEEIAHEQEEMDNMIKTLRRTAEGTRQASGVGAGPSTGEVCSDVINGAVAFTGPVGMGYSAVMTGLRMWSDSKREKKMEKMLKLYMEQMNQVERMTDKKRELLKRKQEVRKERCKRVAKLKMLNLREVNVGNPDSLIEARARLADAARLLNQMVDFWEHIVSVINVLKDKSTTNRSLLESMFKPVDQTAILKKMERQERSWELFGNLCRHYVQTSEQDPAIGMDSLYEFMYTRHELTLKQRQARLEELTRELDLELTREIEHEEDGGNALTQGDATSLG